MTAHLRANLWLLALTVVLCCVLYPLVLWGIGQTVFHDKAQGSMLDSKDRSAGNDAQAAGSKLIAQPFTADEYFQPRPSAASYNAAASGPSNLAANNYLLRDRVARQLGPIVMYGSGPKKGQLVAPDIESWFQKDRFGGKPGIVAQWARLHPASPRTGSTIGSRPTSLTPPTWPTGRRRTRRRSPLETREPRQPGAEARGLAGGLAVPFFTSFSKEHPGTFPGMVESKTTERRKASSRSRKAATFRRFLRHMAARASRRGLGASPGRHGDRLRLGPGPGHHVGQRPTGS